jgi:hypothetical protein
MDTEFLKKNYFEIFLCIGITCGALFRIMCPELREEEMKNLPITDIGEYIIIIGELFAIYFNFFSSKELKNIYLNIFLFGCIIVTLYYLSKKSMSTILSEVKKLCIFPDDIISIWYHLIYVYIIIYIIYIKE